VGDNQDASRDVRVRGRVAKWFTGLQLKQVSQILTLLALVATAAFGGLDTVDRRVTDGKVQEAFSDGQFTMTIDRASLVREVAVGGRVVAAEEPGRRYLGVVVEVRNDGTIPGSMINEVELADPRDAKFVTSRRMSDGEPVTSIGPGLTENLAFLWSMPEDALPPDGSVTLRISKKQFQELIVTYGQAFIGSPTDYVRVVVPVQVRP
jgi:hypothetical protein